VFLLLLLLLLLLLALVDLWGFTPEQLFRTGASKILFTNGLNDGWSAGSIVGSGANGLVNISANGLLLALNIADGAHHSDLSHDEPGPQDTADVKFARAKAGDIISQWLPAIATAATASSS
jgi:hypothetical protein